MAKGKMKGKERKRMACCGCAHNRNSDTFCEDPMLSDQQQYRYMTVDDMKSMGDDSMRVNVTDDEKDNRHSGAPTITEMITKENYQRSNASNLKADNVDVNRHPVHVGIPQWRNFLVSFLVDARGGAMRGCRHSGVRVIVPPRKAAMPMRVTCRYLRRDKLTNPPPLMEGEALASRILELGPVGAKFLGPVIIEVPHFASLRGKEREIVILRSDNGETWREHTLEASEEAVQDVLNESFEGEELSQLEDLQTSRIVRILTVDFPHYFAVVSRIRQEVHAVGPEGGTVSSSAVPQVQAVFPQAALTKKIRVGLQAHPIPADLVAKLLGNRVAVSPIVTVEPRRRKFHKPITLTIPVPQAANKGMINQYSGDAPTLRLLCSITGGQSRAVWEDVTGSTPLTFVKDCVSFTTTVSARFWLMDCRNISEATKMATELYTHATHVPFMAKFVVFAKRVDPLEARLRVFCMTDDKEDKTLEHQEHFTEVAKSGDVEVLEGKTQYMEFTGNLVPVLKSGEQLQLLFRAFKENRVPFTARIKDPDAADMMGRIMFMSEPKVPKGELPQTPICTLNILLPEKISSETAISESDLLELSKNYSFLRDGGISRPDTIHRATIRLRDIANLLDKDWEQLAEELNISPSDVSLIKREYPNKPAQQAAAMFKIWQNNGNKVTGNVLEKALNKIGREDIVKKCIFNVELVTDDVEKAVAKVQLDQPGFDSLKEELGPSRDTSLRRDTIMDIKIDPDYEEPDRMKESESVEDLSLISHIHEKRPKQHVTITNGTVFNGTSTPIKDKYASEEKDLGDLVTNSLEHKRITDTTNKKLCEESDDEDKKRQRVIADANKIVSDVTEEATRRAQNLAEKPYSSTKSGHDSAEIDGTVERHATSAPTKQPVPAPRHFTSKSSTKIDFHLDFGNASQIPFGLRNKTTNEFTSKSFHESPERSSSKSKIPVKVKKSSEDEKTTSYKMIEPDFQFDTESYVLTSKLVDVIPATKHSLEINPNESLTSRPITHSETTIRSTSENIEPSHLFDSRASIEQLIDANLSEKAKVNANTDKNSYTVIQTEHLHNSSTIAPCIDQKTEPGTRDNLIQIYEVIKTTKSINSNDEILQECPKELNENENLNIVNILPSDLNQYNNVLAESIVPLNIKDASIVETRNTQAKATSSIVNTKEYITESLNSDGPDQGMLNATTIDSNYAEDLVSSGTNEGTLQSDAGKDLQRTVRSDSEGHELWMQGAIADYSSINNSERWDTQLSLDTSPGSGNGDIYVKNGSSRHELNSDTDSDGSPQPRRRSPSKRRTLGSSSGSDVALHEGAELSPLEDDQEVHNTVRTVCSSMQCSVIEAMPRTKTTGRSSCACWTSAAVAALMVLLALILTLEPRTFQRAIYTLSNNVPRQAGI